MKYPLKSVLENLLLPLCVISCSTIGSCKYIPSPYLQQGTVSVGSLKSNTDVFNYDSTPFDARDYHQLNSILERSWEHYTSTMINSEGRPFCDCDADDIDGDKNIQEFQTVSEGASYVLLRAVYAKDKAIFEKSWQWTKKNLQRKNIEKVYYWNEQVWKNVKELKLPQDNLFAWRWHEDIANSEKNGVIYFTGDGKTLWRDGWDTATDADEDIAAALLLAGEQWHDTKYTTEAQKIVADIWTKEVKNINNKYYVLGGDKFGLINGINPSYLRPYYYGVLFADVDKEHPWKRLVETSYEVIGKCDGIVENTTNLPPNWCALSENGVFKENEWFKWKNGEIFGWDAFRTLYWVAQDYVKTGNVEALSYLHDREGPLAFLKQEEQQKGMLTGGYALNGKSVKVQGLASEQFCMNGVYATFFSAAGEEEAAGKIITRLMTDYNNKGFWGIDEQNYYGQNWAWLGLHFVLDNDQKNNARKKK